MSGIQGVLENASLHNVSDEGRAISIIEVGDKGLKPPAYVTLFCPIATQINLRFGWSNHV